MDKTLQLDIVTPDKLVLSERVEYVSVCGVEGYFGVLPGHVPMLASLDVGKLVYTVNGKRQKAFVSGGVADVAGDKVIILAESAELADNIDLARAMAAKRRAEERLASQADKVNMERARIALRRAMTRVQAHDER
ncbi:MAG: F0F1 ATP synthase subunit epsilon [Desulfovibrionaceae bacterium]|nr:F0F1 ATP synthase subunit epsilon [Desulfovibrionaceae bacterium]